MNQRKNQLNERNDMNHKQFQNVMLDYFLFELGVYHCGEVGIIHQTYDAF